MTPGPRDQTPSLLLPLPLTLPPLMLSFACTLTQMNFLNLKKKKKEQNSVKENEAVVKQSQREILYTEYHAAMKMN